MSDPFVARLYRIVAVLALVLAVLMLAGWLATTAGFDGCIDAATYQGCSDRSVQEDQEG